VSGRLDVRLPASAADPAFYFDFTSPESYLCAERILALMPVPVEWVPVRSARLTGGAAAALDAQARGELERLGAQRGLQRFVWPEPHPFDSDLALRAATYAKGGGRVVAFSLAAFRQCYAAGRNLAEIDNVLIAASSCEMHPAAVVKGCELKLTETSLERATQLALARGVARVPAIAVPAAASEHDRVFHGDDQVEAAAAVLARRAA
jgi:2-hydroxychromene-2-carboxylate isomerase